METITWVRDKELILSCGAINNKKLKSGLTVNIRIDDADTDTNVLENTMQEYSLTPGIYYFKWTPPQEGFFKVKYKIQNENYPEDYDMIAVKKIDMDDVFTNKRPVVRFA